MPNFTRVPLERRFWDKVQKTPTCWLWTGATKDGYRYGIIGPPGGHGSPIRAHRLSWELANGPIPSGMVICHSCDEPRCVRPEHLFLGTQRDNLFDARSKGKVMGWKAHTHCIHGHPFSGPNLSISTTGQRICKACGRAKQARHKARGGK